MSVYWESSFPDAVAKANSYFVAHWYIDAMFEYLAAARVAPTAVSEHFMLQQAWIAHERHFGRFDSDLEGR